MLQYINIVPKANLPHNFRHWIKWSNILRILMAAQHICEYEIVQNTNWSQCLLQRREQYPGLILRRNYRSHFEGYFLGISLPKLIQILVREVLNWQVKPCENIWSFLNTCHFKSLFTITSYFRSLFPPFWLSTKYCCWYYRSRVKAHRWQLWLYYWVLTYKQLTKTSRAFSADHKP